MEEKLNYISDEVNFFKQEPIYNDIKSSSSFLTHPMGNLNDEGNNTSFYINPIPGYFLDLSEFYMDVSLCLEGNVTDNEDLIIPIDNIVHSLWTNIEVFLNNNLVSSSNQCYHYEAYLKLLLNLQKNNLSNINKQGFYEDFKRNNRKTITKNDKFIKRAALFKGGVQFRCPILIGLFDTKKFLPDNISLTITFKRNFNQFLIRKSKDSKDNFKINIKKMSVGGRRIKLADTLYQSIVDIYKEEPVQIFHQQFNTKKFQLPNGITNFNFNNIWNGPCPSIILVVFLKTNNFDGKEVKSDRFYFENLDITNINCKFNNQLIPTEGYKNLNFNSDLEVAHPYYELLKTISSNYQSTIDLSLTEWANNGNSIFLFNFSPYRSRENRCITKGTIDLEGSFRNPTTFLNTCLVFGVFQNIIKINYTGEIMHSSS